MNKMTIRDVQLKGKRVFLRVDFNVPLKEGVIKDDRRIRESIPTITFLLEQEVSLIVASHLGRPKGKVVPEMSLTPVAARLGEIIGRKVKMAKDCIGDNVKKEAASLSPGEVMLLENLRFHLEEEKNEPSFAKELASLADVYVNDAFGAAHRAHASVEGISRFIQPRLAGFLIEKELEYLGKITENPKRPFIAILGGAKVSDKIKLIENLIPKIDAFLIGGAMAYTFLKARGIPIGKSLAEDDKLELAKSLIGKCTSKNVRLLLPVDHIAAEKSDEKGGIEIENETIGENLIGVDIGPKTISLFEKEIGKAETIFWNGPLGIFENEAFSEGTRKIALAITASNGLSVVGGGDSSSAIKKFGFEDGFDHISTGGGASLEFVSGLTLPGIAVLTEK